MRNRFICCLLSSMIMMACSQEEVDPLEGLPGLNGLETDPQRMPERPTAPPVAVSVRHILSAYKSAVKTRKKIERNREQARLRAGHLLKLARSKGQDFAELARKYSDDVRNSREGGDLGLVYPGSVHPALEQAAFSMGVGQVSGVVEGPRGFHILYRYPDQHAQAAEILVSHQGAKRYTPRKSRTREQAQRLAQEILEQLKHGASFGAKALAHSDHPTYSKGGYYPIYRKGTKLPKFEAIVNQLEIGQLSDIVETPTGFHIVKRVPLQKIRVRQIEIRYLNPHIKPADQPEQPTRSHQEALELIHQVRQQALQPGTDFAELASETSDGPLRFRGGLMDPFERGRYLYAFETAAFGLKAGEISDVVETETGFHLIKRID